MLIEVLYRFQSHFSINMQIVNVLLACEFKLILEQMVVRKLYSKIDYFSNELNK